MRPVSDSFQRIIRGSHVPIFRATLCESYQDGVVPTGTLLSVVDGDVTMDASADIRSTLDLEVPADMWDQVQPYGDEVYIERGVLAGGGQRIYVGLGYFRVDGTSQEDVPFGSVRISGSDRMAGIIDARLEQPIQFSTNTSVSTVFNALVLEVYPLAQIEYDFDPVATAIVGGHIADEDRFQFLDDLVTALGKIWYWDYRGILVVKDPPLPGSPVWDVTHGHDGVLVELSRERSRDGVYNIVVVTGEGASVTTPVRAVARDINRNSPTYYLGRFGRVPRFFTSQLITTKLGAATAAEKLLQRAIGLPYSITFGAIANPALEVLDPVFVTYSDDSQDQLHVLDRLVIPLSIDGTMTGSTKDKTDLEIEVTM